LIASSAPLKDSGHSPDGFGDSRVNDTELLVSIDTQCISAGNENKLEAAGHNLNSSSRLLSYSAWSLKSDLDGDVFGNESTFTASMAGRGCVYMTSYSFHRFLVTSLATMLIGSIRDVAGTTVIGAWIGKEVALRLFNSGTGDFAWIEDVLGNGTTGLTNHVRQNGVAEYSRPAAKHFATCIHVQTAYLALLAALGVLTVVSLALSILSTWRKETPVWKSSPLAFVFHSDRSSSQSSQAISNAHIPDMLSAMKRGAKTITIQLDTTGPPILLRQKGNSEPAPVSRVGLEGPDGDEESV
jgi:hypothetical protein